MKPTREQFDHWVQSQIRGNEYLHIKGTSETHLTSLYRMSSLSTDPADVAHFDKRAAELLQKARDAHDELCAYLKDRSGIVEAPR